MNVPWLTNINVNINVMNKLDINQIIKEEWENIIISENEYGIDDKIEFDKINLYTEFQKLNQSLFGGDVPEVPMKWGRRKTALGHVKFQLDRRTREIQNMSLWISTFFDVNYRQFLNTLAHEMIHVLIESTPHAPQDAHGYNFQMQAERINGMGLGFNITKTNGEDIGMSDIAKKRLAGKKFIAIIIDLDGSYNLAVTSRPVYERDFDSLLNVFNGAVKTRRKYRKVEINVIESQNVELMQYSQQRSFNRSISHSPISDEFVEELLNDNIIKSVVIEQGKENIISEELQ